MCQIAHLRDEEIFKRVDVLVNEKIEEDGEEEEEEEECSTNDINTSSTAHLAVVLKK